MSKVNGNGTVQRVKVRRHRMSLEVPTPPKRVDFFAQMQDFRCVALAAAGFSTESISKATGYSEGQVAYRVSKSERGRKRGELTQRAAYRNGKSQIATLIVALVTRNGSPVKKQVAETLDKRGLYAPKSRGVLRDDRSLPKR
jgi:hypothetical protein